MVITTSDLILELKIKFVSWLACALMARKFGRVGRYFLRKSFDLARTRRPDFVKVLDAGYLALALENCK